MKDYYQILGINRGSDMKAIRRAFLKLAKQKHPDKSGSNTEAEFIEIYEAYSYLSQGLENSQAQTKSASENSELKNIRKLAKDYAADYKAFKKKVLINLLLFSFLDRETIAALACVLFGFATILKGLYNMNAALLLIGLFLIGLSMILGKYVMREIVELSR